MNAAQHDTLPPSWRRRAWAVLGLLVAASGWMAWQALGLQFNYDFEQFFPADHPETTFYREFRETFGSDNDFLIVGFEGEALTSGFLAEIDGQIEALEALPGVELVQSPTRLELPVRDPLSGMVFQRPLLAWDNDSTLTKDLDRLRQRDDIMGTFVSPSGRAVALTLEHRDGLSKAGCDSLAAAVAEWEARLHETKSSILDIHVSGRAVAQAYYVGRHGTGGRVVRERGHRVVGRVFVVCIPNGLGHPGAVDCGAHERPLDLGHHGGHGKSRGRHDGGASHHPVCGGHFRRGARADALLRRATIRRHARRRHETLFPRSGLGHLPHLADHGPRVLDAVDEFHRSRP